MPLSSRPWELPPDRRSRLARAGAEFERALPAGATGARSIYLEYALTNPVADEEAALLTERLRLQRAASGGPGAHHTAELYARPYGEAGVDSQPLAADLQVCTRILDIISYSMRMHMNAIYSNFHVIVRNTVLRTIEGRV